MISSTFMSMIGDVVKDAVTRLLIGSMMLVWVLTMLGLWFINA